MWNDEMRCDGSFNVSFYYYMQCVAYICEILVIVNDSLIYVIALDVIVRNECQNVYRNTNTLDSME